MTVYNGRRTAATNPRNRIEDFLIDYAHDIDDDKLESWPDYFTEEAVYQIVPRKSYELKHPLGVLYCEGRGMMIDRINALRTANIFEPHTHCHLLSRPSVCEIEEGLYSTRTNFTVIRTQQNGNMSIFTAGKYVDEIILNNNTPLLRDRRVILESHRVDILLVVPI